MRTDGGGEGLLHWQAWCRGWWMSPPPLPHCLSCIKNERWHVERWGHCLEWNKLLSKCALVSGKHSPDIQLLEITVTAHLTTVLPSQWGDAVGDGLLHPWLRIHAVSILGVTKWVHCQRSYRACVLRGTQSLSHFFPFPLTKKRVPLEFVQCMLLLFYGSAEIVITASHGSFHLADRPHHGAHCRFCGESVCQKTLIALCVRTLNCNKFMYAAAPLLENKFYLLINWCFFLVSTKTKIYIRGSEP